MTAQPLSLSHPADWLATRRGRHQVGDLAAWVGAACLTLGMASASVMLTVWLEQRAGSRDAPDTAVMIDLPPIEEIPAAIATLEAAPEVPMADVPETLGSQVQDEPLPDLSEPETQPEMAELPVAKLEAKPDLPINVDAPPAPKPKVKPEPKPAPKPEKAEVAKEVPNKKPVEQPQAAQKPSQESKATTAVSRGQAKSLTAKWGAAIRKKVERRKSYPKSAGGAEGTATVRLTVAQNGWLAGVALVQSSGHPSLDEAALAAVSRAGSFPAAPDGLTDGPYTFNLPISFSR